MEKRKQAGASGRRKQLSFGRVVTPWFKVFTLRLPWSSDLGTSFLCPQHCAWEHWKIPWFPQGAYNSIDLKKKKIRSKEIEIRIEITCPRSNNNWVSEPQMKTKTSSSSLVPCADACFFPQEAGFPIRFYCWKKSCGSHPLVSILVILQDASW